MTKTIDQSAIRAYQRYINYNRKYPDMKQTYRNIRDWHKENKPKNGVYVPPLVAFDNSIYAKKFISVIGRQPLHEHEMNTEQLEMIAHVNALPMFAAWRTSLSVYRVDSEIFEEMLKSPIPKDTPYSIFRNIPDFCVYVEFPRDLKYVDIINDIPNPDLVAKGFWAYLSHPNHKHSADKIELRICADIDHADRFDTYSCFSLIIEDGMTVEEAFKGVLEQYSGWDIIMQTTIAKVDQKVLYSLLPILLWLCVEEPDITNINGDPVSIEQVRQPKGTYKKKTGDFIPPSSPQVYHLGQRLGGEIRQFKDKIAKSKSTDNDKKGIPKRPHIRKGHWHGVWAGTGQNKYFKVNWIPAIFVNMN